jgi:hypothetical protein
MNYDDLVKRLRSKEWPVIPNMLAAADAIEVLQVRVEKAERERDEAREAARKLREALEFYANPLAHMEAGDIPEFYDELDFGEKARAALEAAKSVII